MNDLPDAVRRHLAEWFGGWPTNTSGVIVFESDLRTTPGWDGTIVPIVGMNRGELTVLSVAPDEGAKVFDQLRGTDPANVADTLELMVALYRWNLHPSAGQDVGEWVPTADPRVPSWLKPFNGDVLIEWDDHGHYGAGVGRKMHKHPFAAVVSLAGWWHPRPVALWPMGPSPPICICSTTWRRPKWLMQPVSPTWVGVTSAPQKRPDDSLTATSQ
jgi:hypothetical protein